MPLNPFDKSSRLLAKLDAPGFLGWLLGLPPESLVFRGWLDTRGVPFATHPDQTGDTVAHLKNPAENGMPWAIIIEFQTTPDPDMLSRLLGYMSGVLEKLRPDPEKKSRFEIGTAVVNLTGIGNASRNMSWLAAELVTQIKVKERNLERESADETLAGIESGRWSRCVLPWIPLMAGADNPDTVDRWKRLAESEPNSRLKAEYGAIAQQFAARVKRKELWQEKLKGWNVEESTVANEWVAIGEARGEARGVAVGEARGVALGEARGKVAGGLQIARENLIEVGTKRFGSEPSESQQTTLKAIADPAMLTQLLVRSLDVSSWEELLSSE